MTSLSAVSSALALLNAKFTVLEAAQAALDSYKPEELLAARNAAAAEFYAQHLAVQTLIAPAVATPAPAPTPEAPPIGGVVTPVPAPTPEPVPVPVADPVPVTPEPVVDRRAPDDPARLAEEAALAAASGPVGGSPVPSIDPGSTT